MDLQKEVVELLQSEVYKENKELIAQCRDHKWVANILTNNTLDANVLLHILICNPVPLNKERAHTLLREVIIRWNEE